MFLGKPEKQDMGEGTPDHIIDTGPQSRSTWTELCKYLSFLSVYLGGTPKPLAFVQKCNEANFVSILYGVPI